MTRAPAALAALVLAGCGQQASAPAAPDEAVIASPRLSGRLYTCTLSYVEARGPIVAQSRAMVRMGVDAAPAAPGWTVESVTVLEPLPDAGGFDPWLPFRPGLQRDVVAVDGPVLTLAVTEGRPVTLDTASGALVWRTEGALGGTEITGGCF